MQFFKPLIVVTLVLFLSNSFANTKRAKIEKCNDSYLVGKLYCKTENAYNHVMESTRGLNRAIKKSLHNNKKILKKNWAKISSKLPTWESSSLLSNELPVIVGEIIVRKYGNGPYTFIGFSVEDFYDPDGHITAVSWDFGDGKVVTLPEGTFFDDAMMFHIYPWSDHYDVKFTVYDNNGGSKSIIAYVETPENTEPNGNFTAEYDPLDSNTVIYTLNGTDSDGTVFTYYNDACSGSSQTEIFSCTYPGPGTYPFFAGITDSKGVSIEFESEITIDGLSIKSPPIAFPRASTYYGEGPLTVHFDASSSFDLDGDIVSYHWDFGDEHTPGNYSDEAIASHTFKKPGTYHVKLTVRDDEDNVSESWRRIFVTSEIPETPKVVTRLVDPMTVEFDISNSSIKVPADEAFFFWDFGDGNYADGMWQEHTYSSPGSYTIYLKILDIEGNLHEVNHSITIEGTYDSPVAEYDLSEYKPLINDIVTFDASNSYDPLHSLGLSYRWIFDDGDERVGSVVHKKFKDKGVKSFELWVTNTRGISTVSRGVVQVLEQFSNLSARISYGPKVGVAPLAVDFNSSSTQADHPQTYHEWKGDNFYFTTSSGQVVFNDPGTYGFSYFTKDAYGNESQAFGEVIVHASIPSGNLPPVAVIDYEEDLEDPRLLLFNCDSSSDPDDYVAFCEWKLNGIHLDDNFEVMAYLGEDILYNIELTVTDSWGAQTTVFKKIDLSADPAEIIDFDFGPRMPSVSTNIRFASEYSSIPGQDVESYSWNFGDSNTASGPIVTHSYASAGTYTVTLTITDDDSNTYTVSKDVVVSASPESFSISIIARDSALSGAVYENQTLYTLGSPETLTFNLGSSRQVKNAHWDFGDGNTAFGESVEHTFHKSGTYIVEVTATDHFSTDDTAELTVVVGQNSDCYRNNSKTMCLSDINSSNGFIAKVDSVKWTLGHDRGTIDFSNLEEDYPAGWAKLLPLNGYGLSYDISKAVEVNGDQIEINKGLLPKELPLDIPYRMEFATKSQTGEALVGDWPLYYIGASSLSLNLSETNGKVLLVNPSAQWRKYLDLGSSQNLNLGDLIPGKYAIIATSDDSRVAKTFELFPGENTLSIDFDESHFKKLARKRPLLKDQLVNLKNRHQSITKQASWTQSLCGENSPFPAAKKMTSEKPFIQFSSSLPQNAERPKSIPHKFGESLKLQCQVTSPGLLYGHNKWKYKDGPARCFNDKNPHFYWNEYLKTLTLEDSPVVIKYAINDQWSDEKTEGHFITSASDIMKKNGLRLEDLSARVGLASSEEQDFAQKFQYEIRIPKSFQRPQISFELISDHDSHPESLYSINCHIEDITAEPQLLSLESNLMASEIHSADYNGRLSLSSRYGFFPVHFNDNVSAETLKPEFAKVSYRVNIKNAYRPEILWQGVKARFDYAGKSYEEFITFSGSASLNERGDVYSNSIIFDTANLEGVFNWVRGEDSLAMTITPIGKVTSDYDFEGEGKTYSFKALFDIATVANRTPQICSGGIFPTNTSLFARDEFVSVLLDSSLSGASLRCGDMSTPFGGPFNISSSWTHKGHEFGTEGRFRTFNETALDQDSYDSFDAELRIEDLEEYLAFSNAVKVVSLIEDEEELGISTDKKKILDYCKPSSGPTIHPCNQFTTFENLSEEMIHNICLSEARDSFNPPGCPVPDLSTLLRFAKWADLNSSSLQKMKNQLSFVGMISSGRYQPLLSNIYNWQEKAIVYGKWPDGFNILKISVDGSHFENEPLNECTKNGDGCWRLSPLFVDDAQNVESISISNGWR